MATLELPLQVQTVSSKTPCGVLSKECNVVRMRFSPTSSLGPSFSICCKDVRSRTFRCMSVDVKSDSAESSAEPSAESSAELDPQSVEARRAAEKFAVLNTGKWECRSCGYIYDQVKGDPTYPIAAGTEFQQMPADWRCPTCGSAQSYFNSKSVEVAGFAENQNYGLGTNSLTAGQKSLLIYGSLLFFFCLFLSGYFLQ